MPDPSLASAALAKTVDLVVAESLKGLAKTLHSQLSRVAKSVIDQAVVDLQVGFQDYLRNSYAKCKTFKSILTPNLPLSVSEKYLHVDVRLDRERMSDVTLIEKLDRYKSVVIAGLAGSGKSMFMKYLTVNRFEATTRGSIPLFVELRHLNGLKDQDLITFIRVSSTGRSRSVSREQFELCLSSGAFILLLDGFDEVNWSDRDRVQQQILDLHKDFPATQIVVSSRPDDRFGSWTSFYVFEVEPLNETQTIKLIEGFEYDQGVKTRFLKQVKLKL